MSEASARAEAESNGAEERIRTSTGLPPPAPQAGASAVPPLPRSRIKNYSRSRHRAVDVQQVIDQPLCVGAFDEEAGGAGVLDRMERHRTNLHGQPQDLDGWQLGADAPGGLDAVHLRHRDVHQYHVGPEHPRLRDRLESVGRLAHVAQLEALL